MRVPLSWLRELVGVHVPSGELAERLSTTGTAVDGVERWGGEVSGVVVGTVLDVKDVEGSAKLCVAQVDAGGAGRFQVVAGAKNFRSGDSVPFAPPGAKLPGGVRIGAKRLAGVESQGMLCSAHELGISDDHGGILVLEGDHSPGTDVATLLELDDEVLALEIYPNRPDLLSMIGVAREVALLFDVPRAPLDVDRVESGPEVATVTSVSVDAPDGCPRYVAMVIDGLTFGPSPALVQSRLTKCGMRPLGNLVDSTNYVLLLTGQPLHAFDLDRLAEERIVVRRAREGEKLTTIDGAVHDLDADDLVIADAKSAQALAGVMGGTESEVSPSTRRVLLESAYFAPSSIRRTAQRHRLRTEASVRFERGADPEMAPIAAGICASLLREWAGGRILRGEIDVGAAPHRPALHLRPERIDAILGVSVEAARVDSWLLGIGCEVDDAVVTVPSWRPDLEREIDLIEEIARLYGYDNVPARQSFGRFGALTRTQLLRRRVRDVLLGAGLHESSLTSFVSEADLALVGSPDAARVRNPISSEQTHLRTSLGVTLLRAAERNAAVGVRDVRLFEIGTVFGPGLDEEIRVGCVLAGSASAESWHTPARAVDAYDAKGIVEVVLSDLGIRDWALEGCDELPFHGGRSATVVVAGERAGRFGEVRPSVLERLGLTPAAVLVELSLDRLIGLARDTLRVGDVPRFPSVTRDIAAVVDEGTRAGDVIDVAQRAGGALVESVALFDVYRGDQVPAGRKSLALRLVLRSPDRTLTTADADVARAAAVEELRERFAADIR